MRHVGHDDGSDTIGRHAYAGKVDHARVRAGADDDQLRLALVSKTIEFVVVDALVLFAHTVRNDRVELTREVERMPVRQVSAVCQVHSEHNVAWLQHRETDGHVGLRTRVRLHVGVFSAEQGLCPRDGRAFDDVHVLATAVVPLAWVAFRVLVGEHRAGCLEHGAADEVFRRDQLQAGVLAGNLARHGVRDFRIGFGERAPHRKLCGVCWHWSILLGGVACPCAEPALRVGTRPFGFHDLIDATLMASAGKRRVHPHVENFVGQPEGHDASTN